MQRTIDSRPKHESYNHRPMPTMQLLAKLSKFNGTKKNEPTTFQPNIDDTMRAKMFESQFPTNLKPAEEIRPETEEKIYLDPNLKQPTKEELLNAENGHRSRYKVDMGSTVGKLLHHPDELPPELSGTAKRMTGLKISNVDNSLIGGQPPQGDPYQTTTQTMNAGDNMEIEGKHSNRKKIINKFEPELFISPITGDKIADYGNWAEELKKGPGPKQTKTEEEEDLEQDPVLKKLKAQLKMRGAKGIIGLGRLFKNMDDDGSKNLSFPEFKKAMKEFGMALNDTELVVLFKRFDLSKNGNISYNDFLTTIAGSLNRRRKVLVMMAFDVLDKDQSGELDLSDMAMAYDTSRHPDVIAGKKTSQQVLLEFLDGFDVGGEKDGKVTKQEFINYYATISASIDNDDYFELMIRNAWHISGGEGASANSANRRVLVTKADGTQEVVEIKNDLGLNPNDKNEILRRLKAQGVNAVSISLTDSSEDPGQGTGKVPMKGRTGRPTTSSGTKKATNIEPSAGIKMIINKIKAEMKKRGSSGFAGMQRRFRIMDDDGSKSLNLAEFKKAMKELKVDLADSDLRMLFEHFDRDSSGSITFDEFIQGVREPLNEKRLALVKQAFNILDTDGSGIVDAEEIASKYDASKHPEVLAKRKTTAQVLREFLDNFDVGGVKDGKVTQEEFINYYTNIGANIDNDEYFELMIRNAWHIAGGEGASANSSNMTVLVTDSNGMEKAVMLQNDLGVKKDDFAQIYGRLKAQGIKDIRAINGKILQVLNINGVDIVTAQGETTSQINNPKGPAVQVNKAPVFQRPKSALDRTMQEKNRPVPSALPPNGNASSSNININSSKLAYSVVNQIQQQKVIQQKKTEDNIIGSTLLEVLRVQLLSRGTSGIIELQRKFQEMDTDHSKALSKDEFRIALQNNNISFSIEQFDSLFQFLDTDRSGYISYDELLMGLRGPLNPRILVLVHSIFDRIDTKGKDAITPQELILNYDASRHPDVSAGARSADDIIQEFLDTFDVGGVTEGLVTREEFVNYYHNIGAAINDDDYLELILRRVWHLGEDTEVQGVRMSPNSDSKFVNKFKSAQSMNNTTSNIQSTNSRRPLTAGAGRNAAVAIQSLRLDGNSMTAPMTVPMGDQGMRPQSSNSSRFRRPNPNPVAPISDYVSQDILTQRMEEMKKEAINLFYAGKFAESESIFQEVLTILQSIYPTNHPECVKIEKSILMVQRKSTQPKSFH